MIKTLKTPGKMLVFGALALSTLSASAQVFLTDNFTVSSGQNDPNFDISSGRQGGTVAVSMYTGYETPGDDWNHQVGSTTDVGQPGGASNPNYLLLALTGAVQNNLNLSTTATGPLAISFDLYNHKWGHPGDWGSFTMQAPGTDPFPVVNANEFGFLSRNTGGIQMFDGTGNITPSGWDTTSFATNFHWVFIFTDTAGTGSAFNGNGSKVTIMNGIRTLGTITLNQLNTTAINLGFTAENNGDGGNLPLIGVDNLSVATSLPPAWLPNVVQDISPVSTTVAVSSNAVFTVALSNSPPVSVQWQQVVSGSPNVTNNVNTGVVTVTNGGVVTSTLTINNAQPGNSGAYQLKAVNATNSAAVVYSSSASLAVVPTITWYAAGTYNGSFVDNTFLALAGTVGNEVYGVDFGGSGLLTTGNGYTFDDVGNGSGNMTVNGTLTVFGGFLGSATTGDGNLDIILNNGLAGSAANTASLNNLTIGQAYTVMVILDDTRTSPGGTTFDVTDGVTVSPSQQYAYPNGVPKVGGYIMGTFTATTTNQPLTVLNNNGTSQYVAVMLMKGIAAQPNNPPTLTKDVLQLSEVSPGTAVNLSVAAVGSTPIHYQWSNQSGPISGQTSSNYIYTAAVGTNSFSVAVTNAYGSVTSSVAVVICATNIITVANFSFEADTTALDVDRHLPLTSWTPFGNGASDWIGVAHVSSNVNPPQYSINNPLAAPASGNQHCWINSFTPTPMTGLYQDVGPLKTNMVYTLTVAIGSRADRINSPGVISLIRGSDNTGTIVATGGGIPAAQDSWQDYTVVFTNGTSTSDLTVEIGCVGASTIQADFDNVRLTAVPFTGTLAPPSIQNPSFEAGTGSVPAGWTPFNDNNFSTVTPASGSDYTVFNPLAPTADGNNFFAINEGPSDPTGGIYQIYGPITPDTTYTLTVAIGRRADFGAGSGLGSPGIISLLNGDNSSGTVLASTSGIPATANTWQDYTVKFNAGPFASGDLTVALSVAGASTFQANFDNVRLTTAPFVPVPNFGSTTVSGGNLVLSGSGGSPNGGYTLLTTTNLVAPITWTTNSTGTLDNTGAFSKSIPIGTARASFYRVRVP